MSDLWKIKFEDEDWYYRIYDKNKNIAGYFAPNYGNLPDDDADAIIQQMHRNKDVINNGFLTIPLVKFGIFDTDYESNIQGLIQQIKIISDRLNSWNQLLQELHLDRHVIKISHTDQDMLSLSILLNFSNQIKLDNNSILGVITPILNIIHQNNLI